MITSWNCGTWNHGTWNFRTLHTYIVINCFLLIDRINYDTSARCKSILSFFQLFHIIFVYIFFIGGGGLVKMELQDIMTVFFNIFAIYEWYLIFNPETLYIFYSQK